MAWNTEAMETLYPQMAAGWLARPEKDRVNINPGPLARAIGDVAGKTGRDVEDEVVIEVAKKASAGENPVYLPFMHPVFGWVVEWASEVGADGDLEGLLNHADRYLRPTWEDGGLFYPRCVVQYDERGESCLYGSVLGECGDWVCEVECEEGDEEDVGLPLDGRAGEGEAVD